MTTTAVKPPFADTSPAEIRAALLEVHDTLESWRRVAWLVSTHGHDGYRRMMAQAQETLRTGQSPPGSVGIEAIEELIRERLGR